MTFINIEAFKYAIEKIDDGFIFENFALRFLNAVLGADFIPVGGSKDKGIDGFQHFFQRKNQSKRIFQISTEHNIQGKIEGSITKLNNNGITFDTFTYVTNRIINNKDALVEQLFDTYGKSFTIFDQKWFSSNADYSQATIAAYHTFIESYFHEFNKPGKTNVVSNLDGDPRLFVFLRQQIENRDENYRLDDALADSLILYSLEGTDPDKGIFRTETEIKQKIERYLKFNPQILSDTIKNRLQVLSTKPRKINHHKQIDAYCLPYETRLEIYQKDLADKLLYEQFYNITEQKIEKYLKQPDIQVKDVTELVNSTVHKIFYMQGLEFANFIIQNDSKDIIDTRLPDIINQVVDESHVVNKNKENVKTALLMAIRDMVYNGTVEQKKYLHSLSNTYLMMFMLHWDPKISTYFEALASKLDIFVCTSIIIPALSEYYLNPENKRYWNLLKSANSSGIKLYVNESIINELVAHFHKIINKYNSTFKDVENFYLNNEFEILYIDEILIKAYFYSKMRKQVFKFTDFIDNFASPSLDTLKNDLIEYLKYEFGITYISNEKLAVKLDEHEKTMLYENLKKLKNADAKAETDAALILTIYKIREKNNESDNTSLFGYKTWWLSTDTKTHEAVLSIFKDKYSISCYMRPDFLYHYISLTPKKAEIDSIYKEIFPSLLGISLSFHLPKSITNFIQEKIVEHSNKNQVRVRSIIREISDKLKSEHKFRNIKSVKQFWDEAISKENLV